MSITFARYLHLLEELQAGSHKSATELSDALAVDARSIRRYVEELRMQGYDIKSVRGPNGGYSFKGNVYLPPMHFTDNEALALSYGLLLLKTSDELSKASETALARLEPVLPNTIREKTKALRDSVNVQAYQPLYNVPSQTLIALSEAIQAKQSVYIRYHAFNKAPLERTFDPYAVAHMIGLWFVVGYCHLRKAQRIFRIDRIIKLEPIDQSFEPPIDFDVIQVVGDGIAQTNRGDRIEVVIDLGLSLEEAQSRMPPGRVVIHETAMGVRTTAYVKELDEVVAFLAASMFSFKIIRPVSLKDELRQHLLRQLRQIDVE